jgi:hypothetical protein
VAGGNQTVNDMEVIYAGVVRMDTIRIGFFLGVSKENSTDYHVALVSLAIHSCMERQKKKFT